MLDHNTLRATIGHALTEVTFEWPFDRERGKVRDIFHLPGGRLALVTTDRLSAFDRILTAIPYKGQVLNQLSDFWFDATSDLIPNHIIAVPDPNMSVVHACEALPVEVIVRGYITGVTQTALWYRYSLGERHIYGYQFPDGMQKNQPLPEPIITPTTKGRAGEHDERITCAEVVGRGLLDADTWDQIQAAALAIFSRGQALAQRGGLILVDTKYEFGRSQDGTVMIIDPENPDCLTVSTQAYDSKVAGIVSGGKDLKPGLRLGADQFDHDIALAGRVYCNVDATSCGVEPGDLLTTAAATGYAMKATDRDRAYGAILGKAMEPLAEGEKGQILVLVTLE